jgi:hypothetical protein
LTPDPERRLWVIHENMRHSVEWADRKIVALTAFTAMQMALIELLAPSGPVSHLALVTLSIVLPLGVFAYSPLTEVSRRLPFLEPSDDRSYAADFLLSVHDIATYSQSELINRMDKYLGGGISATPYYEDIVGQIVIYARIAARKQRLFRIACIIVGIVQLGLFVQLIWRV